jgi:hypothetical protein
MARLQPSTDDAVVHDLVEHDQPNHLVNSCKQSKNKQEQDNKQLNCRWKNSNQFEYKEFGVLEIGDGQFSQRRVAGRSSKS